ncbi:unnamed protein product [Diatraea saccharalis]|uniref:Uncharacterized protein n=1 Tax=Diatraea saccharalis TaxID=40085 RepID=A0A9N9R108_9NEOP|nr:unnamed protein product [Diatraea saccharalis]
MRILMIIISMQITKTLQRKYVSSSDESIENLLYYKDCQHKPKSTEPPVLRNENVQPPEAPRQPDCPFPKMCCSMSCGNDCGSSQSYLSRQMEPLQNFGPMQPVQLPQRTPPHSPVQPQIMQRSRKKKIRPPTNSLMGMGMGVDGRRDAGFTKERIKNLISQDGDIRKILKDLVRVTMQKVDLLEMMNTRRNNDQKSAEASANSGEYE